MTVWWDHTLRAGQEWSDVIEQALDAASCVVVLWSANSIRSEWVKLEAREGRRRRILAPAFLDSVILPLEFRHLHTEDLSHGQHEGIENLCSSVAEILLAKGIDRAASRPLKVVRRAGRPSPQSRNCKNLSRRQVPPACTR